MPDGQKPVAIAESVGEESQTVTTAAALHLRPLLIDNCGQIEM